MEEESSGSPMSFLLEATAIGLAWLALFALVDTIGDEMGAWPTLPLGALRDVELVAGFAAGLAVLAALLSRPRRSPGIG